MRSQGRMCVLEEGLLTATHGASALVLVALIRGNFVRLGSIRLPAASFREQKGDSGVVCVGIAAVSPKEG